MPSRLTPEEAKQLAQCDAKVRQVNATMKRRFADAKPQRVASIISRCPLDNIRIEPPPPEKYNTPDGEVDLSALSAKIGNHSEVMATLTKYLPTVAEFFVASPKGQVTISPPSVPGIAFGPRTAFAVSSNLPPTASGVTTEIPSTELPPPVDGGGSWSLDWSAQWSDWVGGGWVSTVQTLGISAAVSFGLTLLDSLIAHVFEGYPNIIKGVQWSLRVVSVVVGLCLLAVAIYSVASGGLPVLAFIFALIVGVLGSILGYFLAKLVARFLDWALPEEWKAACQVKKYWPPPDSGHVCGQEPGYLNLGKCLVCLQKPATVGFIHEDRAVAHVCCCEECFQTPAIRSRNTCWDGCDCRLLKDEEDYVIDLRIAAVGATELLSCGNCVFVGLCGKCQFDDDPKETTIECFRVQVSSAKVELLSCPNHKPANNANFHYGHIRQAANLFYEG